MKQILAVGASILIVLGIVLGYRLFKQIQPTAGHFSRLRQYWQDPDAHQDWAFQVGERCGEAPFLQPTSGYAAFLWSARYQNGRRHQGVDVFGPTGPDGLGETPVVSVYDGYLTRLPDWRSTVIIRIPQDPLEPDLQIWTYYTHMADPEGNSFISAEFPPGTYEVFVPAGKLLGYQGNYSADPNNPTGMHLHFSIVQDDGHGEFKNELEFGNTLDPSPYLGIQVSIDQAGNQIAACKDE